jgi:hypothetical protein
MGFSPLLCEIVRRSARRACAAGRIRAPRRGEQSIVTPEELERERKASRERRQKAQEARRTEQAPVQPAFKTGLSRAQRQKLRDDEYIPPSE